jgi:hypothetical protein
MNEQRLTNQCSICEATVSGDVSICPECDQAFESTPSSHTASDAAPLDLTQYSCRMFPWEQGNFRLPLMSANRAWLILALGLVVLVLLLALLRTPLPSCWEVAS